jgi:hypothetical protein
MRRELTTDDQTLKVGAVAAMFGEAGAEVA